jgi:tetratricopeptide (TPR) repeat protein
MSTRAFLALLVLTVAGCANPSVRGGDVHLREGRREGAEAAYRQAIARNPDDADAHFDLAEFLAGDVRAAEAIEHYERAQALEARFKPKVAEARRRNLKIYNEDAERLIAENLFSDADRVLDAAHVMVPGDGTTLFLQGRSREAQNDPAGAVEAYRLAAAKDPGSRERRLALAGALTAFGEARFEAGEYSQSWDLLQEARRADPDADLSYVEGTVAYALAKTAPEGERGRYLDAAAEAFTKYRRRHPDDTDAQFNLGAVLLAAERYQEAIEVYQSLLVDDPKDGDLYMVLSRAHSFAGEPRLAAVEEAIGHALRGGDPVQDLPVWAGRAAARFPGSDLASAYSRLAAPEAIHTYSPPGGALVEVWFYWNRGLIYAFRDGGEVGTPLTLPRR